MSQLADGPPTSNVMEVSTYSQVVFNEVPQSYIPNTPVNCSYIVTAAIEPHRRDWVGIFKVGWSTTRDYYTFVWAAPCSNLVGEEPVEQHVTFDAYYLPKEDGEFYQFCFVDSNGQVRGASTPFRFESPGESSLDYSMGNDLLVITTQDQVELVEKEKVELHKEMEKQKETTEMLRAELKERLLEISSLRESNVELGESVSRLEQEQIQREREREEEREQWTIQLENERKLLASLQGSMEEPTAQNAMGLQESLKEGERSASTWQEKYEQAVTKMNQLKEERVELKEKIASLEAEITQLCSSVRELEQEKQQNLDELQTQQDRSILLQVDLQSSQKETVKLAGELRTLRARAEEAGELRRENQALQRTLSEQDGKDQEGLEKQMQCDLLTVQLQEAREELRKERQSSEEAHNLADRALREVQEAKEKLKQLTDMQKTLDEQINMAAIMKIEKEELFQDNQDLRETIEKMRVELARLDASSAISFQHPNPYSPSHAPPGTQNPGAGPLLYGNPFETQDPEPLARACQYCFKIFPGMGRAELDQHEESHKVCPFCSCICDSMDQPEFEKHVYSHD